MPQVMRSLPGTRTLLLAALAVVFSVGLTVAFQSEAEAAPVNASYYGAGFAGQPTASGVPFDPQALTAAHPYLPFGTELQVCYESCETVTVNDRGPFVADRGLDLSRGAADAIGLTPAGVDTVDVQVLN